MLTTKTRILFTIPFLLAIVGLGFILVNDISTSAEYITGMVETTEIDIASKIPGRIDSLLVSEGSKVDKGDLLARLESKEMKAKVEQARGAMEAALAKQRLVNEGARPEEKQAAMNLYQQAKHQYEFVEKTWNRFKMLYDQNVISLQERDEMEFKFLAANEQMQAAKAKYDMALNGARKEDKAAIKGLVHQAENAYNEAMAYYQELSLTSPVSGEVSRRLVDPGEVIAAGYPIATIMVAEDAYVILQIREDRMVNFKPGNLFTGFVPALGNNEYQFNVTYIAPMADFATWKATNQKGDFDLKSFEIHLKPNSPLEGLRPGMTVNIAL